MERIFFDTCCDTVSLVVLYSWVFDFPAIMTYLAAAKLAPLHHSAACTPATRKVHFLYTS